MLLVSSGMSVLNVIALQAPTEGLVTPFGGHAGGYLFGDVSPLRRYWLKLRLKPAPGGDGGDDQRRQRQRRAGGPAGLRVTPWGRG